MVNFLGRTDSKETHDVQSLRNAVTTVRNLLAPAIRLAGDPDDPKSTGAMQAAGVKELEIYFIQSLQRAQKELSRWGCLRVRLEQAADRAGHGDGQAPRQTCRRQARRGEEAGQKGQKEEAVNELPVIRPHARHVPAGTRRLCVAPRGVIW